MNPDLEALLAAQRALSRNVLAPSAAQRKDRLHRAIALLVDHEAELCDAMAQDFGVRAREQSQLYDIVASIQALKHALRHVDRWMKPDRRPVDPLMRLFGASARIEYQPKGVVGVLSPWNFPIYLTFTPLAGILAAGNSAMIKPSEHTPATSEALARAVAKLFDPAEMTVVTGDADVAARFSALPFDHIIFTGSTAVGRHVMRAAADNLVPLTLELGGKSPVIVGSDPDHALMAKRIVTGKLLNAGQICLAPDYLLVPAAQEERVVSDLVASAQAIYPELSGNADYAAVLGDRNRARLAAYVEEAVERGARPVQVGHPTNDGRLPFTILRDCPPDARVMTEEIFGPVLPVLSYETVDEAIAFVNARPRPLGLYYFGRDQAEMDAVLARTISGGVTLNDVIFHVIVEDLPFGGVGDSGFGVYHGAEGFREFSNARGVFRQSRFDLAGLAGLRPPYGPKLRKYIDKALKSAR
ncbi:MAG: coniferyl aldehyde dehydrogenase [Novosphingobium sp.]|uniref:coniferyl aldehyde dehydrogenase n=1 Tax=Thauera propionica TaxID=2019431 RepID=UPI0023F58D73|nr:coniferyl aldehyde dehydrogenase [Thauera propionica]MDD3674770.1 coniferyl aldehyde dehydrogenase [Thauera propionica]